MLSEASVLSVDEAEEPVGLSGCNAMQFEPTIASQPSTNLADSPSGLDFDLHQPQPPALVQSAAQTGRCGIGTWKGFQYPPEKFTFRWLRNGVPIPGATSANYAVKAADAGAALQCEVIAFVETAVGPGHALSAPVLIAARVGWRAGPCEANR